MKFLVIADKLFYGSTLGNVTTIFSPFCRMFIFFSQFVRPGTRCFWVVGFWYLCHISGTFFHHPYICYCINGYLYGTNFSILIFGINVGQRLLFETSATLGCQLKSTLKIDSKFGFVTRPCFFIVCFWWNIWLWTKQ